MKKRLILLVILVIVLIIVVTASVIIINNLEKNKLNLQENGEGIVEEEIQNQVKEEFVEVLDNGIKQNISTKLKETKVIDGLEISNIDFFMSNYQTIFRADITNKSGKDTKARGINIIMLNKDGSVYTTIPGVINDLKNGEKTKFETAMTLDYANAYDFRVEYQ